MGVHVIVQVEHGFCKLIFSRFYVSYLRGFEGVFRLLTKDLSFFQNISNIYFSLAYILSFILPVEALSVGDIKGIVNEA